ncbi:MATE family efflux transporter [Paraclostridium sordellii]|uniref:MATE family efflux transporter n=1 Tax=Paraclostridium sordellii TaxID=1505 RepID=UPI0005DEC1FC|nr:MATE family efflux transporter [Paeniclostridium sordellii]CEO29849.1 MATE efflux family protein [[Clostridium] sordellii] [Paeniclostridium sordellii]
MTLTKDISFYKSIFKISLPIATQNLITFAISLADTMMAGKLGEISLSACAISNNIFFILAVIIFGVGSASSVMGAQYFGKKDIISIHKIMSIMYKICFFLALFFTFISYVFAKNLISIFTDDILVINEGVRYLKIISLGYIFYAITNCTIIILRSVKTIKISLLVYGIALIVNIFLNWVLIFGKLGFPPLGITGAAIATIFSRICELIVILIFMFKFEKKINFKIKFLKFLDKPILNDFIKVSTPIILNEMFWSIGSSMICIIVSRMGTKIVAANSINNIVNQFATLFIYGLSSASSVIIGNTVGEGENTKVVEYADTICILSIFMGALAGITIYILRPFAVNFYNIENDTKLIASQIMLATSIISVFRALSSNVLMGVLRGGGDNKFAFLIEMLCLWCFSIPLGFISAFILKLPIFWVFIIIRSDEVLKSIIGFIRVTKGNWINNVTRDIN